MKPKFELIKLPSSENRIKNKIEQLKKDLFETEDDLQLIADLMWDIAEYLDEFHGDYAYVHFSAVEVRKAFYLLNHFIDNELDENC